MTQKNAIAHVMKSLDGAMLRIEVRGSDWAGTTSGSFPLQQLANETVEDVLDRRAVALLHDLPPITPVLTGLMRGNWGLRRRTLERDLINTARANPTSSYPRGFHYPSKVIRDAGSGAGLRRRLRRESTS